MIPGTSSELLLSEWSLTTLESSEFGFTLCSGSGWTKSVSIPALSASVLFVPKIGDKSYSHEKYTKGRIMEF